MRAELVVASNRGPVTWTDEAGELIPKRGFGGLVTALGGALQNEPGTWVSVALSEADSRVAAEHDGKSFEVEADGSAFNLRLLDVGERYDAYYNEVANRLLWFTLHQLWGEPYEPSGTGWRDAWRHYLAVNSQVADAVAAVDGSEIYLQDYHLTTAPARVRELQPDANILQYLHTPWSGPSYLRRLPDEVSSAVLRGLLAADVVAFSSPTWSRAFRRCADELLGAKVDGASILLDGRRTVVADFVLGVDADALLDEAQSDPVRQAARLLDDELADRKLVLRVDRTDLSKNILRGLLAYELLLERHPEHRGRVWHYAHLNPSRQSVDEYSQYLQRCRDVAARIAERFGDESITMFVGDDYPRAVAALQRSDVLLANPVTDGTNLVAKEGPVVNQRNGVLVLSPAAGAADVMGNGALLVNPYDVEAQSEALHAALTMDDAERTERAAVLARAARRGRPAQWFEAQRQVLRAATSGR
jgi:trehalose 6-phosphate synthase